MISSFLVLVCVQNGVEIYPDYTLRVGVDQLRSFNLVSDHHLACVLETIVNRELATRWKIILLMIQCCNFKSMKFLLSSMFGERRAKGIGRRSRTEEFVRRG